MEIINGEKLKLITGCKQKRGQIEWLRSEGITFKVNARGEVFTTDDWMNGKDKYQASNEDGFNLGALDCAS